jgi:hypothetical protein
MNFSNKNTCIDIINKLKNDVNLLKEKFKEKKTITKLMVSQFNSICECVNNFNLGEVEIANIALLKKMEKIGNCFKKKSQFICEFQKSMKNMLEDEIYHDVISVTGGSFTRQFLEVPFAMADLYSCPGYGNCIGRDIDIYLFKTPDNDSNTKKERMIKAFDEMKRFLDLHEIVGPIIKAPKFGQYTLIEIIDTTVLNTKIGDPPGKTSLLNIPHFVCIFQDEENVQLVVDIVAWKPFIDKSINKTVSNWSIGDFDVNKIIMTSEGISVENQNFFEILNHISTKEASCFIDIKQLHDIINQPITRQEKIPQLNQFVFFITNRMKIISSGYTMSSNKSHLPKIKIELDEPCVITQMSPPFPSLLLDCDHCISIMGYYGIINEEYEYTEALNCPLCRNDLRVKFESVKTKNIICWTPILPKPIINEKPATIIEDVDEIDLFSCESINYMNILSNIFNATKEKNPNNSNINSDIEDELFQDSDDEAITTMTAINPTQIVQRTPVQQESYQNLTGRVERVGRVRVRTNTRASIRGGSYMS